MQLDYGNKVEKMSDIIYKRYTGQLCGHSMTYKHKIEVKKGITARCDSDKSGYGSTFTQKYTVLLDPVEGPDIITQASIGQPV